MYVNFGKLKSVIRRTTTAVRANCSVDCLCEFNASLANYIEYTHGMSAEELSMFIMSLENWRQRRHLTTIPVSVRPGDIFYADLGIGYHTELSYPHPVLILEKVGNMVMVVPSTTSRDRIDAAYHPLDNPGASKNLWKVTEADGFEDPCALVLENVRTFGIGHLISKKNRLLNMPLLTDIKSVLIATYFSVHHREYEKLKSDLSILQNEVDNKNSDLEALKAEIKTLKSEIEEFVTQAAATKNSQ